MPHNQVALLVAHPSLTFLRHPHESEKRADLLFSMTETLMEWRRQDRPILHFLTGDLEQSKPEQGLEPNRHEYVFKTVARVIETAPKREEKRIKMLRVIGALPSKDLAHLSEHLMCAGIQVRTSAYGFRIDDSSALTLRQDNHGD